VASRSIGTASRPRQQAQPLGILTFDSGLLELVAAHHCAGQQDKNGIAPRDPFQRAEHCPGLHRRNDQQH
jgi:hypothetical protein